MTNRLKNVIGEKEVVYTFTDLKAAITYMKTLMNENYVFTCLPFTDCTRIQTYSNAPKPIGSL